MYSLVALPRVGSGHSPLVLDTGVRRAIPHLNFLGLRNCGLTTLNLKIWFLLFGILLLTALLLLTLHGLRLDCSGKGERLEH